MPRKKYLSDIVRIHSKSLKKIVMRDREDEIERELLEDVNSGMKAKDLRDKYAARLTARLIIEGLTATESRDATNAIRDLTDRSEGRPVEKKEVRHHLEQLSDQEIEAMLRTEIDDLQATGKKEDLN